MSAHNTPAESEPAEDRLELPGGQTRAGASAPAQSQVAITRAASDFTAGWHAQPVTRRRPLPAGLAALRERLAELCDRLSEPRKQLADPQGGHWLAVTSGFTFEVMAEAGIAIPAQMNLAVVGPGTAKRAPRAPDLIAPPPHTGETLAGELAAIVNPARRVVFPCSALASGVLTSRLADSGITVERVEVYATESWPAGVAALAARAPRALIVTASSAARALATHWRGQLPALIAIGQPTARTLAELGLPVADVADEPTREGLLECVERII